MNQIAKLPFRPRLITSEDNPDLKRLSALIRRKRLVVGRLKDWQGEALAEVASSAKKFMATAWTCHASEIAKLARMEEVEIASLEVEVKRLKTAGNLATIRESV